jgi:ADP-ribose pyrophosphatase YjhB (NUDIX family)/predicted transcriptional regulator
MHNLSNIQNKIINKFLKSKELKYCQAKPLNIANDLYNYHLQFLKKKGFITKTLNKYKLTDKGKVYVLRMNLTGEMSQYFKCSVLCYVLREKDSKIKILLQRRLRQPYFGDIGTVSGKILLGEKVENAACRKLSEETGLNGDFKFIGLIRKIRRDNNKKVIDDTLFHVCVSEIYIGKLILKNKYGENFWDNLNNAIKYQKKNITASYQTEKLLKRIKLKDFSLFYFTEDIILNNF